MSHEFTRREALKGGTALAAATALVIVEPVVEFLDIGPFICLRPG